MTGKSFFKNITNGREDILQIFLRILKELKIRYCAIGGLAVNVYAEPVVSLDLDLVIAVDQKEKLLKRLEKKFRIEAFEHSINLTSKKSDIRIQLQTDPRYQEFIRRSSRKTVLGYSIMVASAEDVLHGKVWAYLDETRRKSKRQKDLADIFRLVESQPPLKEKLPESIKALL